MRARVLHADVVAGAVVFLFAAVVLVASLRIPDAASRTEVVGPRVLPVTFSGAMAVAALALVVRGLVARARPEAAADDDAEGDEPAKPGQARRFLVVAALLLAYIVAFIPVGYLLSTFAFLAAVSTYIDRRRWIRNLVFAAVFAVVVYVAFTRGLQVELPPGLVG